MFRSDKPVNYEEVYNELSTRLAHADFRHAMQILGARDIGGDSVAVDAFGQIYRVNHEGVTAVNGGDVDFTIRICLAYYILHGGGGDISGNWVAYRDFKDGAFFHASFSQIVEAKIAAVFSGRLKRLEEAAKLLGGESLDAGLGGDLCYRFSALPRTPLALVFYDEDEDFPASARVLYDDSAPKYLDMECLAVLGLILADQLEIKDTLNQG